MLSLGGVIFAPRVQAQTQPDTSLGAEASVVNAQGAQDLVTGGASRGRSLFHSFETLTVGEGRSLHFANPAGIEQIFSRVTGSSPSQIDGTLGVQGPADLFLLNANGIIFGPKAQLDLTGSFTATTAEQLQVGNLEFSTTSPAPLPLLNISLPTRLQLDNISPESSLRNEAQLHVAPFQTITFSAGQVEQAGELIAPAGTVELQGNSLKLTGTVDSRAGDGTVGNLILHGLSDLQINPSALLTTQVIRQALETNNLVVRSDRDLLISGELSRTKANSLTLKAQNDLIANFAYFSLAGNVTLSSGQDFSLNQSLFNSHSRSNQSDEPVKIRVNAQRMTLQDSTLSSGVETSRGGASLFINVDNDIVLQHSNIATTTDGAGNAGNVLIKAGEEIRLNAGEIGSYAADFSGNAGSLQVEAKRLIIDDRNQPLPSQIRTTAGLTSSGNGGDITLLIQENIELQGNRPGPFLPKDLTVQDFVNLSETSSSITSSAFGTGQSGDIKIQSERLLLQDGAAIAIAPGILATSLDQAGNIEIAAQDIQLRGTATIASVTLGATAAGDITIKNAGESPSPSSRLQLTDGAFISTNSFGFNASAGSGDAGQLNLFMDEVSVLNGSSISASTSLDGMGGQLNIDADSVTVAGVASDGQTPSALRTDVAPDLVLSSEEATGQGGLLRLNANTVKVLEGGQIIASTQSLGDAGNVQITAQTIEVGGASPKGLPSTLEAQSTGTGAAGILDVKADHLTIRDRARVTTDSQFGDGGNVLLSLNDFLLLRQQGSISATAGSAETLGNGGNISIDAGVIIALPDENSDITANAFEGEGGNIDITAQGIFGIEVREQPNDATSDITASSQIGLNGTVKVARLAINPSQGLAELPTVLLNPKKQISTACNSTARSKFIATGRGGLPPDPRQQLSHRSTLQDWREPHYSEVEEAAKVSAPLTEPPPVEPHVEAQGFSRDRQGQVHLVSQSHPADPRAQATCEGLQRSLSQEATQ